MMTRLPNLLRLALPLVGLLVAASLLSLFIPVGRTLWSKTLEISGTVNTGSFGCDAGTPVGVANLEFLGHTYDSVADQSTWRYRVTECNAPPGLSFWVLPLKEDAHTVVSASPGGYQVGPDGACGLFGIKWEVSGEFTSGEFSVTLEGDWEEVEVEVVTKAGPTCEAGFVIGPDPPEPTPTPVPEPTSTPTTEAMPSPSPTPTLAPEPTPTTTPESTAAPQPGAMPAPEPTSTPEPASTPHPAPTVEPAATSTPEPTATLQP
ncbi:unnamed protein product, partial [marine sediment metagenome]